MLLASTVKMQKFSADQSQLKDWDAMLPCPALPFKLSGFIAFLMGVLVFANSVNGQFVFDDSEAVLNNQDVHPESPLLSMFQNDFWGTSMMHNRSHKSYRPITVLTFRWNYWMAGGMHPFSFHITNVLLHGIVSALVVPVSSILFGGHAPRMSFLTASLFAVHPVHTEVVAGVVGRADLLCAFFSFLAILVYVKAVDLESKKQRFKIAGYLTIFVTFSTLALLSKEQGITVIGICFVYDVIVHHRANVFRYPSLLLNEIIWKCLEKSCQRSKVSLDGSVSPKLLKVTSCSEEKVTEFLKTPSLIRWVVLFLSGLLLLVARWYMMGFKQPLFQEVDNPASFAKSFWIRVWSYNYLYALNVWLLVCPEWLCFDWSMGCVPLISQYQDPRCMVVFVLWTCFLCLLWQGITSANRDSGRSLNMAFAVSMISFLPASNVFFRVGFVLAERVLYLPSLGYCMLVVLGMRQLTLCKPHHGSIIICAFSFLLLFFCARCIQRSGEWQEELTLFRSALAVCPLNAKVHYNVAKNAGDLGDRNRALKEYEIALQLHPHYDQAMNNMANILRDQGRLKEAESLLKKAVKIRPDFAAAWMNLGIVLAGMKRHKEAEACYLAALSHRSQYPECLYNLGNLYLDLKMHSEALEAFQKAVLQKPTFSLAWNNMVIMLESIGNLMEAKSTAYKALSILPDDAGLHFNLANTLGKLSLFAEAEEHFKEALMLSPTNAIYHSNLGVLYHRWKKYNLAEAKYQEALDHDPGLKSAINNLNMLKERKKSSK